MMGKVCLTFYGGVEGEVGGNQILLQDDKTKILIDFGYNFSRWRNYFSFPLTQPKGVSDYFKVKLIPQELREPGKDFVKRDIEACFVTHAHGDHYGALCGLAPPKEGGPKVFLGEAADKIITARITGKKRKTPELTRITQLDTRTFRTGRPIKMDNIEVVPWHVDHSLPGAYAFLIHTTEGLVVYTGDFRLHGTFGRRMRKHFWHAALEAGEAKALICEATSICDTVSTLTEKDVERHMENCVKECGGLVIVNTSICDIDRIKTVCRVARKTGRIPIASESFTTVLNALKDDKKLEPPRVGKDVLEYEKEQEKAKRRQSAYILLTTFYREKEIIEMEPTTGSVFILSSSEPFEEESEIEFERLKNWLELFGVPIYHVHSSGHALPMDLRRVVRALMPRKMFPVHTSNPHTFERFLADILKEKEIEYVTPERGVKYEVCG